MRVWGFSEEQLWTAARRASNRLGHKTQLCLRGVNKMGVRVKTISFILRFESSTKRLLKRERSTKRLAEYPPGVLVRSGGKYVTHLDAIPASELFEGQTKYRKEWVPLRRSCGAPCWHTFGHFLRCLFEINPNGRVKTGLADYRGASGFEESYRDTNVEKGSMMNPLRYSEACDCHHYGVEDF